MKVEIIFHTNARGRIYDVDDVYTKDALLCLRKGDFVTKYPLCNIFSIAHEYGIPHGCGTDEEEEG